MNHVPEQLDFTVEVWTPNASTIVETLARASHLHVARAAYEAALKARPNERITLRLRAQVLAERRSSPSADIVERT
jgi:hypothetical protein